MCALAPRNASASLTPSHVPTLCRFDTRFDPSPSSTRSAGRRQSLTPVLFLRRALAEVPDPGVIFTSRSRWGP
eukprot:1194642-Prorocentrum_minimum.AAC.5